MVAGGTSSEGFPPQPLGQKGFHAPVAEDRRKVIHTGLDGIRAIAFLLVFAAHAGMDKWISGGLGVTIFLFLSGYLITTLLRREALATGTVSLRQFYIRRAIRILPPLYLVLIAVGFLSLAGVMRVLPSAFSYVAAVGFFTNYYSMLPGRDMREGPGMETLLVSLH